MESALIYIAFFGSYWNGNRYHSFDQLPLDNHHGGFFVPLPTRAIEDVEVFDL